MVRLRLWERAIVALAALKVVAAVVLFAAAATASVHRVQSRDALMIVHVVAFGAGAVMLLSGGRRDARATLLGAVFILGAAAFADNALGLYRESRSPLIVGIRVLFGLQVDAFTAYFMWRFVDAFPRVTATGARYTLPRTIRDVSLAAGMLLFAVNVLYSLSEFLPAWQSLGAALVPLTRRDARQANWYWFIQYALTLPALPALVWKARAAPEDERRRVSLLVSGLFLGMAPLVLWVLFSVISLAVARRLFPYAAWIIYPALLSTPFTTAYAVLVQEALETRLIARRAARYALGRYALLAAASIPLVLLAIRLFQVRDRSVQQLVTGANGVLLLILVLLAAGAMRRRRKAIETLDRRFFRESYDSRQVLADVVERCRRATSWAELGEGLAGEIERALHPLVISVRFLNPPQRAFVATRPGLRPLDASSALAAWIRESAGALDVDFERPAPALSALTDADRHWLADTETCLVMALKDPARKLVGVISLGAKKSDLPYSAEDRSLLNMVAAAAALPLAYLGLQPVTRGDSRDDPIYAADEKVAAECAACGWIDDFAVRGCTRCGSPMEDAVLPRDLNGKFRLIERIGRGGMGVVYRAIDVTLDRTVALKTLPRMSARQAARLHKEARTIAALSHPNLALIFGAESWHGVPILVFEFLAGGTLTTRLAKGPLAPTETMALGLALADVAGALHRAGVVHRDIKPSNIGFTVGGTLKLLDFGVARLLSIDSEAESAVGDGDGRRMKPNDHEINLTDKRILGTPLYLSPEALAGRDPDPSFDLWSICLVLFESLAGRNPAQDDSPLKSMLRIETCSLPDLGSLVPNADPAWAAFFRSALSANAAERPRTAESLREQLARLGTRETFATATEGSASRAL